MTVKAAIRDGGIVFPEDVLRKAHFPKNAECLVEVGERVLQLWLPPDVPDPDAAYELPDKERMAWAVRGFKQIFPDREPQRRLLRLVGLGPRATVEEQREELYNLMNERYEEKRGRYGSHTSA